MFRSLQRVAYRFLMPTSTSKKIAIIGAGVSGLQAARTILSHPTSSKSYDVIVFEARDRIGGRVQTKQQWGVPLDYGAAFMYGTDGNPLAGIAEEVGSTILSSSFLRKYYDDEGVALNDETASLIYRKIWDYSKAASTYSRENDVTSGTSVEDFFRKRVEDDHEINGKEMKDLFRSALQVLSGIAACDLDKLSLKYYWMEDSVPGKRGYLDSTYDPIVQYIARPSISREIIKLNTQITSIAIESGKPGGVTLTSAANEIFHADAVIVTIPLGSLQRGGIKFTPQLPSRVQTAISDLGFGVNERFFIRFATPWWLCPIDGESNKLGLEIYLFPSQLASKTGMPEGRMTFHSLARTHDPRPVFAIFVATKLGAYLVSQPKEKVKDILQTFYVPSLPNYDAQNPAHRILDIDSSSWSRDEFSGFGSYTYVPAGSDSGDVNMEILSEKILSSGDGGGLWFAGEHTADTEILEGEHYTTMATVAGAYKSGERAAKLVLRDLS